MPNLKKAPKSASRELRSQGAPAIESMLGQAPQLTSQWGRLLAFLAVFTGIAFSSVAFKPEVGHYFVLIYIVAVGALLWAAHKKLLD
jgi:hypothetical protein